MPHLLAAAPGHKTGAGARARRASSRARVRDRLCVVVTVGLSKEGLCAGVEASPQVWQLRQDVGRVLERAQSELTRLGAAAQDKRCRANDDAAAAAAAVPGAAAFAAQSSAAPINGHVAPVNTVPSGAENSRNAGNAAHTNPNPSPGSPDSQTGSSPKVSTSRRVNMRRKKAAAAAAAAAAATAADSHDADEGSNPKSNPNSSPADWPGVAAPGLPAAPPPPRPYERCAGFFPAPAAAAGERAGGSAHRPGVTLESGNAAGTSANDAKGSPEVPGGGGEGAEGKPAADLAGEAAERERARGTTLYKASDWKARSLAWGVATLQPYCRRCQLDNQAGHLSGSARATRRGIGSSAAKHALPWGECEICCSGVHTGLLSQAGEYAYQPRRFNWGRRMRRARGIGFAKKITIIQ